MAKPYTIDDTMRIHDTAVHDWLGGLLVDYGTIAGQNNNNFPILRVFASPQRAMAQVVDLLISLKWITNDDKDKLLEAARDDFAVLPLPIVTIERGEPQPDPELSGVPKVFRRIFLNCDTGKWEFHQWPAHYKTDYTFTFWSVKRYTMAFLREWVYGQLGQIGASEYETFLDVVHRSPWNTIKSSFKFTGSGDLSDLEGENSRYMRVEFTFTLRTWMTKEPSLLPALPSIAGLGPTADFIERISLDALGFDNDYGITHEDEVPLDAPNKPDTRRETANLFFFLFDSVDTPTKWPKTGGAEVEHARVSLNGGDQFRRLHDALRMKVTDQSDSVEIAERLVIRDPRDFALAGISFDYLADNRVELALSQRNLEDDVVSSVASLVLPATGRIWKPVHRFTVVEKDTFLAEIEGIPSQPRQTVYLDNIDVRLICSLAQVFPDTSVVGGSETVHTWIGLEKAPHLCILIITATTGGINTVTVEDDDSSPAHTLEQIADSAVNVGLVFLVQPKDDSVVARVPNTTTLASVYLQRYHGAYNGHDFAG